MEVQVRSDQFQFLIGTLKTGTTRNPPRCGPRFQFLIGTLKTIPGQLLPRRVIEVSIPHRYAKNFYFSDAKYAEIHVSIPHRYAKNWAFCPANSPYCGVSIPHRYAKNPTAPGEKARRKESFNSS